MAAMENSNSGLSFENTQRITLLRRITEHVVSASRMQDPWILDVAQYPGIRSEGPVRAPGRILTVDRKPLLADCYLRGTGIALPLADHSMDVAATADMLEHVAAGKRETFLGELCRVSRGWIFINGPFRSAEAEQAESSVNDLTRLVTGGPDPVLEEHWQNGLPDLTETRRMLERLGFFSAIIPNGSLFSWFLLRSLEMIFRILPDALEQSDHLNDLYVRLWADTDHRRPTYRHLLLAHRDPEQIFALFLESPPKVGLEFFAPGTEVPLSNSDEAQRIRAAGLFFERLAGYARRNIMGMPNLSMDGAYLRRLEKIVEDQEQHRLRTDIEIADLRARLAIYESSRFVRIWRKWRWK